MTRLEPTLDLALDRTPAPTIHLTAWEHESPYSATQRHTRVSELAVQADCHQLSRQKTEIPDHPWPPALQESNQLSPTRVMRARPFCALRSQT